MAGYYTHINTLADVQENVMEYLHVLSRPMVIDHDHDIIWTEAYMDTVVRSGEQCLLSRTRKYERSRFPVKHFLLKAVQKHLLIPKMVVHWVALTSYNISGSILSLCLHLYRVDAPPFLCILCVSSS